MAQDRHFWMLDSRVLDYVRFSEFHWSEVAMIVGGLSALAGYALLAVLLDRRARSRALRLKQVARLDAWLEAWQLEPQEEEALQEMAGSDGPLALYELLADPLRFERAVHEAGAGDRLAFVERVREALGYHSDNLSVPVFSTRQLRPGDHFRFSVWEAGRPQHHYGFVAATSVAGVTVELTEAGFRDVMGAGGENELFFLRENDLEVRFPLVIRNVDADRRRIVLAHQLVRGGQRARSTRLPMLRSVTLRVHTALDGPPLQAPAGATDSTPAGEGDGAALVGGPVGRELRGALLEMSEGGFSLVLLQPVAEGSYVEYALPMPRGRTLPLVGRVLDCRSFAGKRWLVRCELRGLLPSQRSALSQALRLEQQRRLKAMQAERRKRRHAEGEPS